MKNLVFIFLLLSFNAVAESNECTNETHIKVNGLVCDFCAQAVNKVFRKREEVKDIDVNLEKGYIHVSTVEGKTIDHDTLTKLITDSGYDVVSIDKECGGHE